MCLNILIVVRVFALSELGSKLGFRSVQGVIAVLVGIDLFKIFCSKPLRFNDSFQAVQFAKNLWQLTNGMENLRSMDNEILKLIIRRIPFGFGFPPLTKKETEEYIDELDRLGVTAMPAYLNENGKLYLAKVSIPRPSRDITVKLREILNS